MIIYLKDKNTIKKAKVEFIDDKASPDHVFFNDKPSKSGGTCW